MKRILSIATSFLLIAHLGYSQNVSPGASAFDGISIRCGLNRNDGQRTKQPFLLVKNGGSLSLPANGWNIYFNSSSSVESSANTAGIGATHVNGDLFKLYPLPGFKGLKPGDSLKIDFKSDGIPNLSYVPEGFYGVSDANPTQGFAITRLSLDTTAFSSYDRPNADPGPAEKALTEGAMIETVFPTAAFHRAQKGTFTITSATAITADPYFSADVDYLKTQFSGFLASSQTTSHGSITFSKWTSKNALPFANGFEPGAEGYRLSISASGIHVFAATHAGAFYAIQSLLSLFSPTVYTSKASSIQVKSMEVLDAPRFAYRGLMIDVARNFKNKAEILKILDLMALYKLNHLQLHLDDDEGWRLEIPSLPELTSVGAKRAHTLDSRNFLPPSHGSGPDSTNAMGSGFYSQTDYIEILKYAQRKHIQVVPEIETPGHARAAVKAMAYRYRHFTEIGNEAEARRFLLQDPRDGSVYSTAQGWNDNVMDAAMPSTYAFLEKVFDDVIHTYALAGVPLSTIHMGGDEVPKGAWEKSPSFERLRKSDPSIRSTKDLWEYFFTRVNALLKKRHLTLSGYEEVVSLKENDSKPAVNPKFLKDGFHIGVWNNTIGGGAENLGYQLANAGYKVIFAGVSNFYFDMAQGKKFRDRGYNWGGYINLEKTFDFIPFNYLSNQRENGEGNPVNTDSLVAHETQLTKTGMANILGIQGMLWGETIESNERLEMLLLPRTLALAEKAWAKEPVSYPSAWKDFETRVNSIELPKLSVFNKGYSFFRP